MSVSTAAPVAKTSTSSLTWLRGLVERQLHGDPRDAGFCKTPASCMRRNNNLELAVDTNDTISGPRSLKTNTQERFEVPRGADVVLYIPPDRWSQYQRTTVAAIWYDQTQLRILGNGRVIARDLREPKQSVEIRTGNGRAIRAMKIAS